VVLRALFFVKLMSTDAITATSSDAELMRRVQADDTRAFAELYDRYCTIAFGAARVVCHSAHEAEDAVQDGFLAVWCNRASFDPDRGSIKGWLLTVIRHRSIDCARRETRHHTLREFDADLDYLAATGSPTTDAETHEEAHRLRATLRQLPVAQRDVIALAYYEELNQAEIAARLQIPPGTVKGRMRLGLDKLRADINPTSPQAHTIKLDLTGVPDGAVGPSRPLTAAGPC
jgi:RNA polymerase sigma-70 factor (ECF subfamily)